MSVLLDGNDWRSSSNLRAEPLGHTASLLSRQSSAGHLGAVAVVVNPVGVDPVGIDPVGLDNESSFLSTLLAASVRRPPYKSVSAIEEQRSATTEERLKSEGQALGMAPHFPFYWSLPVSLASPANHWGGEFSSEVISELQSGQANSTLNLAPELQWSNSPTVEYPGTEYGRVENGSVECGSIEYGGVEYSRMKNVDVISAAADSHLGNSPIADSASMDSQQLLSEMQPVVSELEQAALLSQMLEASEGQGSGGSEGNVIESESVLDAEHAVSTVAGGLGHLHRTTSSVPLHSLYRQTSTLTKAQEQRIVQRALQGMESIEGAGGAVSIRLHPQELGALHLSLRLESDGIFAVFEVENSVAKDALLQNAALLRDRLQRLGMEIKQFDVHVAAEGGGANASFGSNANSSEQRYQTMESRYAAQQANRLNIDEMANKASAPRQVWFRNGNNLDVSI